MGCLRPQGMGCCVSMAWGAFSVMIMCSAMGLWAWDSATVSCYHSASEQGLQGCCSWVKRLSALC